MSFLNPLGLLGLFGIPVVIGLHLHLERNRRVLVSSMFLWKFLDAKFQGQKPKFVRFTWLLFFDLALVILFSLALAQPQLKLPALGGGAVQKIILLDDSLSMLARDGEPDRFALGQDVAVGLIEDSRRRDEVVVITVGGAAEVVGSTLDGAGKREIVQAVRDLSPAGYGVDLRNGLAAAQLYAASDLPVEVTVITDAAYPQVDLSDFPFAITWAFIGFQVNNQAVLGISLEPQADGAVRLFCRLENYSSQQADRDVEIWVNGEVYRQERVSLLPDGVIPLALSLPGSTTQVEVRLLGEDTFPEDDRAVAALVDTSPVQVALVSNNPGELGRAVSAVSDAQLTVYAPGDVLPDIIYDLVLFRGVVPQQWPQGTVAVFDPPKTNDLFSLGEERLIQSPLRQEDHPVLQGVQLERVRWDSAADFSGVTPAGQAGLEMVNTLVADGDQPLLMEMNYADGKKLIFLPNLGAGNFTKDPAFPILIGNLVAYSREIAPQEAYLLGDELVIPAGILSQEASLTAPDDNNPTRIREAQVRLAETGFYTLEYADALGEMQEVYLGVNAGDPLESEIAPQDWRFTVEAEQAEQVYDGQVIEVNLGPWLLWMAVILLGLEAWRAWR